MYVAFTCSFLEILIAHQSRAVVATMTMQRVFEKAVSAVAALTLPEAEKEALRRKAHSLHNECGCSMGTYFVAGAIAGNCFHLAVIAETHLPSRWHLLFIFIAALSGKLLGIAIARARLFMLYRKFSPRSSQLVPNLGGRPEARTE
jgi:hypothetical protein